MYKTCANKQKEPARRKDNGARAQLCKDRIELKTQKLDITIPELVGPIT